MANKSWQPFCKIAKIATKNRQNRQVAELAKFSEIEFVEHQILSGKMVSQAKKYGRAEKLQSFQIAKQPRFPLAFNDHNFSARPYFLACDTIFPLRN